jgi:hypothetical protein
MVKITKLPPGEAIGADDLQNWSRQRNAGRSGTRDDRQELKWLQKQKRRRKKSLRKHRRKYPRKGLADIAFEEAQNIDATQDAVGPVRDPHKQKGPA